MRKSDGKSGGKSNGKYDVLHFHENKKDAERPYDHFAGGIAPRSLLCVRKRMFSFFIKHALGGLHLEKNIQILIYFKRLPTSCRGAELTFFMLTKILIYFSRLPTSCAHLLYPSDGYGTGIMKKPHAECIMEEIVEATMEEAHGGGILEEVLLRKY